jgi:hypothetical protein
MKPRTSRTRTTLLALAAAAILIPSALARPIPDDGDIVVPSAGLSASPAKPSLQPTKPGMKITQALYLAALAGTATTSP